MVGHKSTRKRRLVSFWLVNTRTHTLAHLFILKSYFFCYSVELMCNTHTIEREKMKEREMNMTMWRPGLRLDDWLAVLFLWPDVGFVDSLVARLLAGPNSGRSTERCRVFNTTSSTEQRAREGREEENLRRLNRRTT